MAQTRSVRQAETTSGVEIKPVYRPEDVAGLDYQRDLGDPGEFPYTRGPYPLMYREKYWTMRTYTGFGTPRATNEWNRRLLAEEGVTGLSTALDLPTQMGYDSDHPEWRAEVGRVGVAIDSLADFEVLFNGIPLDQVSTSFTINAPAFLFLALYQVAGEKQGVGPERLRPIVQNDILKEFFARGACVFPVEPSLRLVADTFEYCSSTMPRANPISVCGYHIRESGATAVQEMAFAISNAREYIDRALARGIPIDSFAPRISWNLGAFMNFFEEVAKYRASRRIWARLMREGYGAQDERSWRFLWFAGTCGSTFSHRQPLNNIVRATVETMALVLGGLQSLTVNTWQEAFEIPDQEAMLTALRTQQIVAHESGIADTADPLAGSYFVESLTDEYERRILELMDDVRERGGMARCIENGYVQRLVLEEAYRHSQAVETGERKVVGENIFVTAEEPPPTRLFQHDPAALDEQLERLAEVRRRRSPKEVERSLARLREAAAQGAENLMPYTVECVRAYATVGEVMGALRQVFGTYREPVDIFG
ncbi:MAG: methylmalonyl-CoA mutase [Candidatus Dormibacteraeota bacterium]|uniref:Methylmalonyl-CoA mutase n=1 Tax=Candidatus Dormiibacter inghamiae TaxID=3127013 RepID=A0A934NC51_9BACT|nr:methylmalonyl-CoA mutase [Candidatus Dormibacteraeota bacterium]MBJ7606813.1 methylmalonyl-CoA mutase [Candidatus Dormibacteraeota bacterium]